MAVSAVHSGPVVPVPRALSSAAGPAKEAAPFSQLISKLLNEANEQQLQSEDVLRDFVAGKTDDIHDLVLSVAKADLSFRLVLEIRNRLIESYQEIMRMQV